MLHPYRPTLPGICVPAPWGQPNRLTLNWVNPAAVRSAIADVRHGGAWQGRTTQRVGPTPATPAPRRTKRGRPGRSRHRSVRTGTGVEGAAQKAEARPPIWVPNLSSRPQTGGRRQTRGRGSHGLDLKSTPPPALALAKALSGKGNKRVAQWCNKHALATPVARDIDGAKARARITRLNSRNLSLKIVGSENRKVDNSQ